MRHVYGASLLMPKKKLTKTQVNKKLGTASAALYDLTVDKIGHFDSFVPMSEAKISEIRKLIFNARKRLAGPIRRK